MAWRGNQPDQEYLCCSICGDRLRDPGTIPCGHRYCMRCIKNFWDGMDEEDIYCCPKCGRTFIPRPVLVVDPSKKLQQNIRPLRYHEEVMGAMSRVTDTQQNTLSEALTKISLTDEGVLPSPAEPKTRAEFLRYSRQISMDPNTAHTYLLLSEGNRKVTRMSKKQVYSDHARRFTNSCQVLSTESLTGRCYWEVERRGGEVKVSVAYKDMTRAGKNSKFGNNKLSWSLYYYFDTWNFLHNRVKTPLSGPQSSRVGVYLDHRAGLLSFYSVSETMTLLHRVQTTFTQPLYAGIGLFTYGASAEFS